MIVLGMPVESQKPPPHTHTLGRVDMHRTSSFQGHPSPLPWIAGVFAYIMQKVCEDMHVSFSSIIYTGCNIQCFSGQNVGYLGAESSLIV